MEADLDARASVAGGALAAVQQANDKERNSFEAQSEAQRNQLLSSIAWEFRKLLYTQQVILANAKLPGFQGPTVDSSAIAFQSKVCSVMHSAFYLRARVGETSHVNMLNKQLESLERFIQTQVKTEPSLQPQFQTSHFQLPLPPPPPMQFPQPPQNDGTETSRLNPFPQPPPMYAAGQIPQPMQTMGVTTMPLGFQPQMMMQGHQAIQMQQPQQQFMGQLNPQFQPTGGQQQNN